MLMMSRLIGLVALATSTVAQLHTVDTGTGIVIGLAIPDVQAAPFDVVVSISAPAKVGWAGLAWGGTMLRAPLSVAWPNEDSAVVSSRWTDGYITPQPYEGASIFVLPASKASSAGWTAVFLCEGCSEWAGGSLDPNGEADLAFAFSTQPVADATDPDTRFGYHTERGSFGFDLSVAKMDDVEWDALITSLSVDSGPVEDEVPDKAEEGPEEVEEPGLDEPGEPVEDTEELPEEPEELPDESIDEPVDEPEEETEGDMGEAEEDPAEEPEKEPEEDTQIELGNPENEPEDTPDQPEEELEETEEESEEDTETPVEEPAEELEEPPEEESEMDPEVSEAEPPVETEAPYQPPSGPIVIIIPDDDEELLPEPTQTVEDEPEGEPLHTTTDASPDAEPTEEPSKIAVDPPTTTTQAPTLILTPDGPFPFPDLPIDGDDLWELLPDPILLPLPPIFTLLPVPVPDDPFTGDETEDEPPIQTRVPDSPLIPEPVEPIMEEGEDEDEDEGEEEFDWDEWDFQNPTTTTLAPPPAATPSPRGRGGGRGRGGRWGR